MNNLYNSLNKEIKVLFDGEILKRIERDNEDLGEKISNLSQKKDEINNNEKGNFKKYKSKTNIIEENDNKEIENKNNTMNNTYKMKVNKEPVKILDNIPLNKKIFLKKNEVDDNLYEIFIFCANQKNTLNSPTFDEIAYKKERLNFEELSKFLIDFDKNSKRNSNSII